MNRGMSKYTASIIVQFTFKQVLIVSFRMYEYVSFGVKSKRDYNGWGTLGVCTCYSYDIIIQYK